MRKLFIAICAVTLLSATTLSADKKEYVMQIKKEGVKYIKMLGKALKKEVKAKMKEDPSGALAMGFCSQKAAEITNEVNKQLPSYAKVKRTSFKVRNKENKPDSIDKVIMQDYQKAIEENKFKPDDIKVVNIGNMYRVYKPLLAKKMCLKCHGENISDDIKAVIKNVYPNDKATGFKEGDLRGVIVAEIVKNDKN